MLPTIIKNDIIVHNLQSAATAVCMVTEQTDGSSATVQVIGTSLRLDWLNQSKLYLNTCFIDCRRWHGDFLPFNNMHSQLTNNIYLSFVCAVCVCVCVCCACVLFTFIYLKICQIQICIFKNILKY